MNDNSLLQSLQALPPEQLQTVLKMALQMMQQQQNAPQHSVFMLDAEGKMIGQTVAPKDPATPETAVPKDFEDSVLYDRIYAKRLLPEERATLIYQYRQRAKAVGGTDLAKLFDEKIRPREKARKAEEKKAAEEKAAEERKAKKRAAEQEKMTACSDLPEDLHNMAISWEFTVNDSGVFADIEHKDYSERKQISRTPMLITRQIADPEGDKERRSDGKDKRVELAYKDGDRWRTTITSLDVLTNTRKMDQIKGFISGIDNENFPYMARFFDTQYKMANDAHALPVLLTQDHMGWDAELRECHKKETETFAILSPQKRILAAFAPKGTPEEWMEAFREIRNTKVPMFQAATAATLASPLLALIGGEGCTLELYGESSIGKSRTLHFVSSIWGDPQRLVLSLSTTSVGQEVRLGFLHNFPAYYDDFNKLDDREKSRIGTFMMNVANGRGKDRATKDLRSRKLYQWQLFCLTTSENRISSYIQNAGGRRRMLHCMAPAEACWSEDQIRRWSRIFEGPRASYGWAGEKWLKIIDGIGRDTLDKYGRKAEEAIGAAAKKIGKEIDSRQQLNAAIIMVADRIAAKFLFQDDIVMSAEWIVKNMMDAKTETDVYAEFYEKCYGYFSINATEFENGARDQKGDLRPYSGLYIAATGVNPEYICFIPDKLKALAKENDIDYSRFLDWLKTHGKIDADKDHSSKKVATKHFAGKDSMRMIKIAYEEDPEKKAAQEKAQKEAERVDVDKLPWGKKGPETEGGFVQMPLEDTPFAWEDTRPEMMRPDLYLMLENPGANDKAALRRWVKKELKEGRKVRVPGQLYFILSEEIETEYPLPQIREGTVEDIILHPHVD